MVPVSQFKEVPMKALLFVLCCLAFVSLFFPHSAEAQCRRGQCESTVIQAPDYPHATQGVIQVERSVLVAPPAAPRLQYVQAQPVRNTGRFLGRVITWPWRALRCR
jgi:hypothetical protein